MLFKFRKKFFFEIDRSRDPIVRLRKNGHCPGHEYTLSALLFDWLRKNDVKLTNTIVFPGCGSGSYELAFLNKLKTIHVFDNIVMMDNDINEADHKIWKRALKPSKIIVERSFKNLCLHMRTSADFNVFFFHKAKEAIEDPYYHKFIDICRKQSSQQHYIHAFHKDGIDCIYSSLYSAM
jgi:hypothetical protein